MVVGCLVVGRCFGWFGSMLSLVVIMVDRYSEWSRWGLVVIVVNGWSSLWLVVVAIGCCIQVFFYMGMVVMLVCCCPVSGW